MQTLDEFITRTSKGDLPFNAYVNAPGFATFYVRRSSRVLDGELVDHVLDLANIEAEVPGNGAFTKLTTSLIKRGIPLYVENVLNSRFDKKLLSLGFTRLDSPGAPSFFKLLSPRESLGS